VRVHRAEFAGCVVHLLDGLVDRAQLHGQRVGDVVAGVHQQAKEQLLDGVLTARTHPDPGAVLVGVLLRAGHDRVHLQLVHHDDGEQDLDQ
jgi:hypothetical protein